MGNSSVGTSSPHQPRALTGRRVAWIAGGAFVFMLIPNIILTVMAVDTFSGLVVPNSYVASQSFDRDRAAQQALGWTVGIAHEDGVLRLSIADATGHPVRPPQLSVTLGRPTTTRDDRILVLEETPSGYAAAADLAPGGWRAEIVATAGDGTRFHQSRDLPVQP
jgi:nitrogen fixation protein FixH